MQRMNMQQQYYSDEEGPSGDDQYTQEGGKDGDRNSYRAHAEQQQQFP